jgi:hypothetical protein
LKKKTRGEKAGGTEFRLSTTFIPIIIIICTVGAISIAGAKSIAGAVIWKNFFTKIFLNSFFCLFPLQLRQFAI